MEKLSQRSSSTMPALNKCLACFVNNVGNFALRIHKDSILCPKITCQQMWSLSKVLKILCLERWIDRTKGIILFGSVMESIACPNRTLALLSHENFHWISVVLNSDGYSFKSSGSTTRPSTRWKFSYSLRTRSCGSDGHSCLYRYGYKHNLVPINIDQNNSFHWTDQALGKGVEGK
ncbi:hypothetical protein E3N88_43823 [Mikania micrantha]|uniref:Uncharacterized protein n=1 Tax=Mikania micrantha TaxID=192012 RepID=A0A5N6LG17_9ASTR|nr:hypothetical protein E3N88_43823 [Mikania micrantha]